MLRDKRHASERARQTRGTTSSLTGLVTLAVAINIMYLYYARFISNPLCNVPVNLAAFHGARYLIKHRPRT